MSEQNKEFAMIVQGVAHGSSNYQAKNDKFYYSGLLLMPGKENNLKIDLKEGTDPNTFAPGSPIKMRVEPRYWNGKFVGLQEA